MARKAVQSKGEQKFSPTTITCSLDGAESPSGNIITRRYIGDSAFSSLTPSNNVELSVQCEYESPSGAYKCEASGPTITRKQKRLIEAWMRSHGIEGETRYQYESYGDHEYDDPYRKKKVLLDADENECIYTDYEIPLEKARTFARAIRKIVPNFGKRPWMDFKPPKAEA